MLTAVRWWLLRSANDPQPVIADCLADCVQRYGDRIAGDLTVVLVEHDKVLETIAALIDSPVVSDANIDDELGVGEVNDRITPCLDGFDQWPESALLVVSFPVHR